MTSNSRSASRSVSELVGSSKTITRASETSARATSTSCCAPTLSVAGERVGPDLGMLQQLERLGHQPPVLAAPDQAGRDPLLAEHDVGLDRQVRGQRQLLVDHRHAARARLARTPGRVGAPPSVIVPASGRIGAAQDLHQRALARAVLADQGVDLARRPGRATTPSSARLAPNDLMTPVISSSGPPSLSVAPPASRPPPAPGASRTCSTRSGRRSRRPARGTA